MTTDLISKRLRNLLKDHLASNSTLREIENEFEAAEIPFVEAQPQNMAGQRRTLVQGYYNGLDFADPGDARKFLNVLAVFMGTLESQVQAEQPWGQGDPSSHQVQLESFQKQLTRDGYAYRDGTILPVTAAARLADAKAIAESFDASHISDQIRRIEGSVDADPALAIGQAKELTESCFKTVLSERGIEYGNEDLPQLGKKVFKALKLLADDVPHAAKGAQTIKVMLSNLSTIVQGLAEIRGLYGTGHGREGKAKGLSSRHARLAVGAASTLVTFVFETHLTQERPS
jgi:hypothetical protein